MSITYLLPVTLVLFNFYSEQALSFNDQSGRYDLNVQALGQCSDSENLPIKFSTKLRKYNRTTYTYTTDFDMSLYGMDDTLSVKVNVAKKGNGGYKENFYITKFDKLCSTLKQLIPDFLADLEKQMGAESTGLCPLPPGSYCLKDYRITIVDVVGVPMMFYGNFRADLHTYKNHDNGTEERICCFRIYYQITPKHNG